MNILGSARGKIILFNIMVIIMFITIVRDLNRITIYDILLLILLPLASYILFKKIGD